MTFSSHINPIQSRFWLAMSLFALVVSIGCDSTQTKIPAKLTLQPADAEGSSASGQPNISVEEAEAFAKAWEDCIKAGDGKASSELVSWVGIAKRTIEPFKVDANFRKGFIGGATTSIGPSFVDQMKKIVDSEGGSYKLAKVISRGGKRHVVFRMVDPNTGLNYHDFQLERAGGKVQASHLFVATTGEEFADTIRGLVAPAIASSNSTFGRMSGEQKKQLEAIERLKEMKEAWAAGHRAKGNAIFKSLPTETQNSKVVLLLKMQNMDIEKDETEYLETIDLYAKLFPGDASLGLITLDAAYLRKDLEMLEESRSIIQGWTGGDPFIDLLVGGLLVTLDKVDEAVELTKDIDPAPLGLADAHDYKMTIALANKDHQTVLKELRVLRDKFGYQFSEFGGVEGYEGFVDSPEHSEWLKD